ncbi:unnamed protein product [Strongylus vulgaris]|uniref:Uncharacterized protein n=1 Tax=Strongylus vulgaris TaxID=40348 RepID=A0A3P7J0U7_STRVU|nr:unnamed protein product [Strongylus vulgaris]
MSAMALDSSLCSKRHCTSLRVVRLPRVRRDYCIDRARYRYSIACPGADNWCWRPLLLNAVANAFNVSQ